jgi:hypothetical protein
VACRDDEAGCVIGWWGWERVPRSVMVGVVMAGGDEVVVVAGEREGRGR